MTSSSAEMSGQTLGTRHRRRLEEPGYFTSDVVLKTGRVPPYLVGISVINVTE